MNAPIRMLLMAAAVFQCKAAAKPPDDPKVRQALEAFSLGNAPTVDHVKRCVEVLEKATLGPEGNMFLASIKELYRAESRLGSQASAIAAKLSKYKSTHYRAFKQALSYRTNPIRDVQGAVDKERTNITIDNLTRDYEEAAVLYQADRSKLTSLLAPLIEQLSIANAALNDYLESGDEEYLIALATAYYAVIERNGVPPPKQTPVTATWLRMRKLTAAQVKEAVSNARKELTSWVHEHLLSKEASVEMKLTMATLDATHPLFGLLGGGYLATQGLDAKRQTELKIQGCLEVLLFEPDANAASQKVTAEDLQKFITRSSSGSELNERFSDSAIGNFLGKIDPRLVEDKSVLHRLGPILRDE